MLLSQVPTTVYERHKEYAERVHNKRRRFHGTSCSSACSFFVDLRASASQKRMTDGALCLGRRVDLLCTRSSPRGIIHPDERFLLRESKDENDSCALITY